jgi:hypothetical protein
VVLAILLFPPGILNFVVYFSVKRKFDSGNSTRTLDLKS